MMPRPGCLTRATNSFKSRYPSGTCRPTRNQIRTVTRRSQRQRKRVSESSAGREQRAQDSTTTHHDWPMIRLSNQPVAPWTTLRGGRTASRGRAKRFLARRTGSPPGAAPSSASQRASSSMRAGPRTTRDMRTGSRMLADSGHVPAGCGGAYLPPPGRRRRCRCERHRPHRLARQDNRCVARTGVLRRSRAAFPVALVALAASRLAQSRYPR